MIALITLVLPIGGDAGPFNLLSNTNGFTIPFETGVSTAALVAGYTSIVVPEGTTTIRVVSTGICTNYIDIEISLIPTTTTTSSSSTSTTSTSTSTTTSTSSTTTTSTTLPPDQCEDPITVYNVSATISITDINSIGMTISPLGYPIGPLGISVGTRDAAVNAINVDVIDVVGAGRLKLFVSCAFVECINVTANGTYSFTPISVPALTTITIYYEDGPC